LPGLAPVIVHDRFPSVNGDAAPAADAAIASEGGSRLPASIAEGDGGSATGKAIFG
jgi:hypothetical protein